MLDRLKQYIVEVCCAYALVSVGGAIVNQIFGFQTNNVNVMIMFVLCLIGTFVLYLHRLVDKFSPLFMIIVQYVAACGLLWSNWCEFKHNLGVEFGEYSLRQYRYAKDYYKYCRELI